MDVSEEIAEDDKPSGGLLDQMMAEDHYDVSGEEEEVPDNDDKDKRRDYIVDLWVYAHSASYYEPVFQDIVLFLNCGSVTRPLTLLCSPCCR